MLEELLAKMISEWDDVLFTIMLYKDSGVNILTQLDDIHTLLEDHIVKVQAMRGSAFVKLIEEEVKNFYVLLLRIQSTIDEWAKVFSEASERFVRECTTMFTFSRVQGSSTMDVSVAHLFEQGYRSAVARRGSTVRSGRPNISQRDERRFEGPSRTRDRWFCKYQRRVFLKKNALNNADKFAQVGLLEIMQEANELMERVNDGVLNYLELKRLFFPRFFFLSNDDMLEILSETKEPLRVQPHLRKCFEGINRLR